MAGMLLHQFPNLAWLKQVTEDGFAKRKGPGNLDLPQSGWPTVVLNVHSKTICRDNIKGPYSYFSNRSGNSQVEANKKRVTISPDYFFLTNRQQRYTLEIGEHEEAETINIHFGEKWVEEVTAAWEEKTETLLDDPSLLAPIHFFNKLYRKDDTIKQLESRILATAASDTIYRSELLYQLINHLVSIQKTIKEVPQALPALKASTREEVMQRLWNGMDYIYSFYHRPFSLDELAAVSCLSKFHFMRLFRQAFGQTPHQFITTLRIEKAKELLAGKNPEIKSISAKLGFENPGSFSRLFFQKTGVYPSRYIPKK